MWARAGRRLIAAIAMVAIAGCQLGAADVERFKSMARGPHKLGTLVADGRYDDALRGTAALALLDLQRDDVDGRALLLQTLERMGPAQRQKPVGALLPGLARRMQAPAGTPPPSGPVQAKDTAVALLPLSRGAVQQKLAGRLIDWFVADLENRAQAGRHGLDAVAAQVGAPAVHGLREGIHGRATAEELQRIARLLAEHADAEGRAGAAARFVEVEKAWRSPEQLRWLVRHTRETLQGAGAVDPSEALVTEQARNRREHVLRTALLPALQRFADETVVTARLLELARDERAPVEHREQALHILEGHTASDQRGALMQLALDEEQPLVLRELALARAGEVANGDALPSLVALMGDRRHRGLRQRAAELVLELGGAGALSTFFRNLPRHWGMDYGREELQAYSERINQIPPDTATTMFLASKLHSVRWWARILALRYFAARGSKDDIWRIRQHVNDSLAVRGSDWPDGHTVGQEAQAAVTIALRRHGMGG